jgi:hypothetical protein
LLGKSLGRKNLVLSGKIRRKPLGGVTGLDALLKPVISSKSSYAHGNM